jgi:hypothetical protein
MKNTRKYIVDSGGQIRKTSIHEIEIDGSNEEELKNLLMWVKNMLGNIHSNNGEYSKNDRSKDVFNSCLRIYNTDISHLYANTYSDEEKYYVYAHCDPQHKIAIGKHGVTTFAATLGLNFRPFYIGMGQGDRAFVLDRNETHRKYRQKLQKKNLEASVSIIKDGLTKSEALAFESKLIDIFGLIVDRGYLVNLDEGTQNKARRDLYENDLISIGRIAPRYQTKL